MDDKLPPALETDWSGTAIFLGILILICAIASRDAIVDWCMLQLEQLCEEIRGLWRGMILSIRRSVIWCHRRPLIYILLILSFGIFVGMVYEKYGRVFFEYSNSLPAPARPKSQWEKIQDRKRAAEKKEAEPVGNEQWQRSRFDQWGTRSKSL